MVHQEALMVADLKGPEPLGPPRKRKKWSTPPINYRQRDAKILSFLNEGSQSNNRHQTQKKKKKKKEKKKRSPSTFLATGVLEKWTLGASGSTPGHGPKRTLSLLGHPRKRRKWSTRGTAKRIETDCTKGDN
ncbi:hypothetical protein CEXT_1131 [Caerostris extrusa]|uniref:Uncharacterized protein n=1 Tax=Caerostris extrusa TaxID=172846 RepID=A0AAV4UTB8_CAEEX|nr:hypothetical protein CEXT_1131 [Caerostris extrusa]